MPKWPNEKGRMQESSRRRAERLERLWGKGAVWWEGGGMGGRLCVRARVARGHWQRLGERDLRLPRQKPCTGCARFVLFTSRIDGSFSLLLPPASSSRSHPHLGGSTQVTSRHHTHTHGQHTTGRQADTCLAWQM